MYDFDWDAQTGAYILKTNMPSYNREIRPVYTKELDLFGFDKYWHYDASQNDAPYMWADANTYWYRGTKVATLHKASANCPPEIELNEEISGELIPVDMNSFIQKNEFILEILAKDTIQDIYNTYMQYKSKVDIFYVAFSGGKDSIVVLDLVKRALKSSEFKVVFGDTQMEFFDTYVLMEKVKKYCEENDIEYIHAISPMNSTDAWELFGPPAHSQRWCCSVLKSTPQIIALRKLMNKCDFRGMGITGVRGEESVSRSNYEKLSFGEKVKGQYSYHPILDWNAAEVFLYIFAHQLFFNEAYKKGNNRVGCLICPMTSERSLFVRNKCYACETNISHGTDVFNKIIEKTSNKAQINKETLLDFMKNAGWKARKSGQELSIARPIYKDEYANNELTITIESTCEDYREWFKTIGSLIDINSKECNIRYNDEIYTIKIKKSSDKTVFKCRTPSTKFSIQFMSYLKNAVKKTAYCVQCHACEANCPFGYIHMSNGNISIDDRCIHCHCCHQFTNGCLRADSLRLPIGEKRVSGNKGINRYNSFGFENSWIVNYFKLKDNLWASELEPGNKKTAALRNFLFDAGITNSKKEFQPFGEIIDSLGLNTITSWALIMCNLAYSGGLNWWIKNITPDITYTPEHIKALLMNSVTPDSSKHIADAFKNIFISNSILGKDLGIGVCDYTLKKDMRTLNSIYRTKWLSPDARVILYSLYKFAEACGDYYQFTLARLLDHSIESDGVSPTQIFCLTKEDMEPMLKGLAINYPEFISASFTHDLDNIKLNPDKSSSDVLALFK